jgi:DNA-binding transcriptional regulator YiaG
MMETEPFSIDVKALRKMRGLNQASLADELGVDQSTVSNWENGQLPRGPARKLLIGMWNEYGMSEPSEPVPTNAIREFREANGLSQEDFGERFNPPVSGATVCRWEQGALSAERATQIWRLFQIPRHRLRPDIFDAVDDSIAGKAAA